MPPTSRSSPRSSPKAQARLNRARIVAPVEGTVLTRRAEVGQIATQGGDALFRVASGGEVEMRGQLAEQDLAQVKVGDAAMVTLTGLPQAFEGRVRLLGAIIDPLRPPRRDPHHAPARPGAAPRRVRARHGGHRQGHASGGTADRRAHRHQGQLRVHRRCREPRETARGARGGHLRRGRGDRVGARAAASAWSRPRRASCAKASR